MIYKSRAPMSPEQLPQQRLHAVVDLPARPPGFIGQNAYIEPMPAAEAPKAPPRNGEFLCNVEWAWSPAHGRVDAYYLNRRRRHWLLWIGSQDFNTCDWKWTWSLYGYAPRCRCDAVQAAVYLLHDAWRQEADQWQLDRCHWINEAGALSVPQISAIAREIWA